ncbi:MULTISPECIES: hypothetical protein [Enorma]
MNPNWLLRETQVFGTLFEEPCVHDVRIYCTALGLIPEPYVYYYGDADGLEVDIIIELPDGRWGRSKSNSARKRWQRRKRTCSG